MGSSSKVKLANKLRMDGDLALDQRMALGEASMSKMISMGLDVHLMLVSQLFVYVGGYVLA